MFVATPTVPESPNRLHTLGAVEPTPTIVVPGKEVRPTASASDPEGDVLTYTRDSGDEAGDTGTTAAGSGTITATHICAAEGRYTVTLSVTDVKGVVGWRRPCGGRSGGW